MAHIGHPLVHDPLYADAQAVEYKHGTLGMDTTQVHTSVQKDSENTAKEAIQVLAEVPEKTFALRAYRLVCYHMRTGRQIVIEV